MEMASSEEEEENNKMKRWSRRDEEQLPGYRFHPTDEELVSFYLTNKVENKPPFNLIKQLDIYNYDPWDITKIESTNVGEKEWFFFCMRARKYRNSVRPNRVTASGFWKATGIDKPINAAKHPHKCVGLKKSLVYYRGHAGKGTKTDWMMHEFRLPPPSKTTTPNHLLTTLDIAQQAEVWTLCRIFKRVPSYKKYNSTPSDDDSFSKLQNPAATATINYKKSPTVVDSCSSSSLDSADRVGDVVDDHRNSCSDNWGAHQPNSHSIFEAPNFWNLNGAVSEDDLLASYLYLCNNN